MTTMLGLLLVCATVCNGLTPPPLRTLLRRRASLEAREEALASLMQEPDRDACLAAVLEAPRGRLARVRLLKYAPVPWEGRDLAALDRVLAIDGAAAFEDETASRRAVLSTLRQLPKAGGVVRLEREARRRTRLAVSFEEMRARTPDGLATPTFAIEEEADAFQVRRYADYGVVRTARQTRVAEDGVKLGEPKMTGAGAFQALAGYIFGGNAREEKMSMTTPVFTREGQMEFVLPESYWTDTSAAPAPISDVELTSGQAGLVAAAFFGGYATGAEVEKRTAGLVDAVRAAGWTTVGDPFSAAYNDPFTPPWRRRNEVLVAVARRGEE